MRVLPILWLALLLPCAAELRAGGPDVGLDQAFDELSRHHGGRTEARVRLFVRNPESWVARWWLVQKASRSIDCTYFILADDPFGNAFLGLLYQKARAGVPVRLMLDGRGSRSITRLWGGRDVLQELAALSNVEVRVYNPILRSPFNLPDLRGVVASNHDKLLVVDGEWLMTGGRNIGQEYSVEPADDPRAFRDTDVLIRDPFVAGRARQAFGEEFAKDVCRRIGPDLFGNWSSQSTRLEVDRRVMQNFLMDGDYAGGPGNDLQQEAFRKRYGLPPLSDFSSYYATFRPFRGERPYPVVFLDKHSRLDDTRNEITGSLHRLVEASREEIIIQNPYVVLARRTREALREASRRGVKILIFTNSLASADVHLAQLPMLLEWRQLLATIPNLRLFAANGPSHMHAKVFVFDRTLTVVGSYNLDPLSDEVNSEAVVVVRSQPFARRNALVIERDLADALEYKVARDARGRLRVVQGPANHVARQVLEKVRSLSWLKFLRPVL